MRDYTAARTSGSDDQFWVVEHPPVYTLGRNGDASHVNASGIPVIPSDRGGQATYHGPGQAVLYTLMDLRRRGIGVRRFVELLEQAAIDLLDEHGIAAARRRISAPGVYVGGRKIAALGLRVSRGRCYHGIALNVRMDLRPFRWIVVCGMTGMEVTQMSDEGVEAEPAAAGLDLARRLTALLV